MALEGSSKTTISSDSNSQYHCSHLSVTSDHTSTLAAQTAKGDIDRKKRSCESCRQRKIKCDRGNPCSQCTSSFHDCVYVQPRRRQKKLGISSDRIAFPENRLRTMESLMPLAPAKPSTVTVPTVTSSIGSHSANYGKCPATPKPHNNSNVNPPETRKYGTAYHTIEQGEIEFQGQSGDRTFIQDLKTKLCDWDGGEITCSQLPPDRSLPGLFEPQRQTSDQVTLPTKELARKLVDAALDAQILLPIIHRPSFDVSFNSIYSLNRLEYGTREVLFLPLLYAVLAYGCLFMGSDSKNQDGYEMIAKGSEYFFKSRQLQDIANCRDLVSLQAIVFMNLFLLTTNRISTCYTHLCASLSIAVRMGLHRSLKTNHDLISQEISKRLFWALWLLVNDVASCCGLPRILSNNDIDQEFPREANDVYISSRYMSIQPPREICYISGANASYRLQMIRDKVTRQMYSAEGLSYDQLHASTAYAANLEKVRGIKGDLKEWADSIPRGYLLGTCCREPRLLRAQYILCISYAYVHLYLHRPFLQYTFRNPEQSPYYGEEPSCYAIACIQASQNIVLLCEDMCKRGLLCGGNWPATRMLCSSVVTLFYTILASRGSFQPESLFKSLATGRKLLDQLAKQSYSASRFKFILVTMTSTLPESLQHVRDRLFNFDSDAPNVRSMETPEHNCGISNNSYTASLAGMVFSARPDSRLRRPNLLPLSAGLIQHSDGGILKSDLAREKHQYLQIGQALSSPMNEATEWATMQPKIQTTETNAPGNQRPQSPLQTPHLQIQAATEDTQFSPMPNATAPEPSDQHWQAQTFRSHQDGSAVTVCNGFDIDNACHLEINEESLTDIFNAGEFNLGDIDEFFDFGSWF